MKYIKQEPTNHPEGDAFVHTMFVVKAMSKLIRNEDFILYNEDASLALMLSALLHDIGKATTTIVNKEGKITSYGHDKESAEMASNFMEGIGVPSSIQEKTIPLIREHMFIATTKKATKRNVRRLSIRLYPASIFEWEATCLADLAGRPGRRGKPKRNKIFDAVLEIARNLNIEFDKPEPIVKGRHLIDLGVSPGVEMGEILRALFENQLDGDFDDLESGLVFAEKLVLDK